MVSIEGWYYIATKGEEQCIIGPDSHSNGKRSQQGALSIANERNKSSGPHKKKKLERTCSSLEDRRLGMKENDGMNYSKQPVGAAQLIKLTL